MIGTSLELYTIEAELNQDEHFTLYQGRHISGNVPVTIKVVAPLYTSDEFFVRRFKQIAGQVAQLEHPNILPAYEAGQTDNWLYVAQDAPGVPTLAQVIENEASFSPQRMRFIAQQIASALDYAHQKSVTHGHLSTHNVYLGPDDHVLIADFGQSQVLFGANVIKHAHTIASPETLAPERVNGQGPSRQADLYALGVLCYQMLIGKPPFTGPASSVLHAQAHKQPLPPHLVNASVPLGISKVIGRMLSKGVELRYNTGAEFTRALAMARHDSNPVRRFDYLMPITEREQQQSMPFKTFLYIVTVTLALIFAAVLFGWAGYEIGLKRANAQTTSVRVVAAATIVTLQTTPSPQIVGTTKIISTVNPLPTFTPTEPASSMADTLLPTWQPHTATPTPFPTVLPTAPVLQITPVPSSTPLPSPSANQTKFIFTNAIGYDLIVDLTGPTPISKLIPPGEQFEFLLEPGAYQYIAHTLGGGGLQTVVGNFELSPGQLIEKDYYSDYDWTQD